MMEEKSSRPVGYSAPQSSPNHLLFKNNNGVDKNRKEDFIHMVLGKRTWRKHTQHTGHSITPPTNNTCQSKCHLAPNLHASRNLLQALPAKRMRDLGPPSRLLRLLHRLFRIPRLRDTLDHDTAELEQFFLPRRRALFTGEIEEFHCQVGGGGGFRCEG